MIEKQFNFFFKDLARRLDYYIIFASILPNNYEHLNLYLFEIMRFKNCTTEFW